MATSPGAAALVLLLSIFFWVAASDAQGLSYYSDKTTARLLALAEGELREARRALLDAVSLLTRRRFIRS